ncbi:unnamed protein product [Rhizoctonia solani]|uniref:Uncharacterized protein n=1 Tax=Rhizoctonia solani TaxID=456999 RepID=A0A8H2XZL4_9AGAM|nr:unnamed protein product [Rhizoctonia solani]
MNEKKGLFASCIVIGVALDRAGFNTISENIGSWFCEFRGIPSKLNKLEQKNDSETEEKAYPLETTMTDHLISWMRNFGAFAERTPAYIEVQEGHDVEIRFHKTANKDVICFLQAKIFKDGVVDFLYGFEGVADSNIYGPDHLAPDYLSQLLAKMDFEKSRGKNLEPLERCVAGCIAQLEASLSRKPRLQADCLHEKIWRTSQNPPPRTEVTGGYVIYGYAERVLFIPIGDVLSTFKEVSREGTAASKSELNRLMTARLITKDMPVDESAPSKKKSPSPKEKTVLSENQFALRDILKEAKVPEWTSWEAIVERALGLSRVTSDGPEKEIVDVYRPSYGTEKKLAMATGPKRKSKRYQRHEEQKKSDMEEEDGAAQ